MPVSIEKQCLESLINNMVLVEGGSLYLQMKEGTSRELAITMPSFYINKYPVSKKEWQVIMGKEIKQNYDNYPIVNVSWDDCYDFINRLNRLTGKLFRLPSVIEWEFAAYGGNYSHGYMYSGSNNPNKVAWYKEGLCGTGIHEIATKEPNELGLYDMSGNIWEWCQNNCKYHNNPYNNHQDVFDNNEKAHKILKGGSAGVEKELCKIGFTWAQHRSYVGCYTGFRLAI